MTHPYDDLKTKLREMFQMDQADLDFGIYRIMNAKRAEIEAYLDNDLKPQVAAILAEVAGEDTDALDADIKNLADAITKTGLNPEDSPKYQDLIAKRDSQTDLKKLELEVFSDLYSFFARYYEGGDFLSLRRYKAGVYAIPYEGEEVKLHWANADQYYIKTSEYFANYAFRHANRRVLFQLVAASTEQNNNKAAAGKERRFILSEDAPLSIVDDTLIIGLEYRADAEGRAQKTITEETMKTLSAALQDKNYAAYKSLLSAIDGDDTRSVLESHLNKYTARNSFDYFIHKDLGGFLRRELDFFLKNEVLILENVIAGGARDLDRRVAKLKALKAIADKIILFLTGLEEFQKKLWLKKKFVVEANWCMTLDMVDESFYDEILANDAQRAAWAELFAIDEIPADLASLATPDAGGGGG